MPPVRKPGSFRLYPKRDDANERAPDFKGWINLFDGVTYTVAIWRDEGGFSGRIEPEKPKEEPF